VSLVATVRRALERYNPMQRRDHDGRWSDGMPNVITEVAVRTASGALHARSTRHGHGNAGHRDVELDDGTRAVVLDHGEQKRLADALGNPYRRDAFVLSRDGRTIARVSPSGHAESDDGERLADGKRLRLGDDDGPGVLLSNKHAGEQFAVSLGAAAGAGRHETGFGPLDVFSNERRQMTLRMRSDDGRPTEVTFSAVEWNRVRDATNVVYEGFAEHGKDPDADVSKVRVRTKAGPVDVEWTGPRDPVDADSRLRILPAYPAPWSVVIDGEHLPSVLEGFDWAGINTGVHESVGGTEPGVSIAVELWRALEAWEPGKHPRGPGGLFVKGAGGGERKPSLADAVKGTADAGPKRQRSGKGGMSVGDAVRKAARTSDKTGSPTRRTDAEHRAHGAHDVADEVDRALDEIDAPSWVRKGLAARTRARADSHGPRPDSLPAPPKAAPKVTPPAEPKSAPAAVAKPRRTGAALPADRVEGVAGKLKAAKSRTEAHEALAGLTVPQLRQVAEHHGLKPGSKATKAKIADVIVDGTAGRRLDSTAISRAVEPNLPKAEPKAASRAGGDFSAHAAGGDLIGSDPATLARQVTAARSSHQAADLSLSVIGQQQGFDGKPRVVSKAELDRLVEEGHPEIFRGVKRREYPPKSAAEIHEEMRSGHAFYGNGAFGNGYYWGDEKVGKAYSDKAPGSVARAVISPDAKIVDSSKLRVEHEAFLDGLAGKPDEAEMRDVYEDLGRYAASRGYDAVRVDEWSGEPFYNVLNRTALVVEEGH
jgi:hypothetical protein